jgi:hypothetical protein
MIARGLCSSFALKVRPMTGETPRTGKRSVVVRVTRSSRGWSVFAKL